ncbi:DNA primase/helicase [Microbacterium phage Wheelie]|nr:DNA primase/helicase [Microbacterium phage Wheelie]
MGKAYDTFLEKLESHGRKIQHHGRDRARAQCPSHGGDDLNLSIAVGDQGLLVSCKSYDCPPADIMAAVGLTMGDMFDNGRDQQWSFPDGRTVVRSNTREGKRIIQRNVPPDAELLPLLRHPLSEPLESPSEFVVLVEGEKSVHAALMLGYRCVTTWPQGANQAENADLSPLHGKDVVLIADNDEQGMKAMATIRRRLELVANVLGVWTAPGELGSKRGIDDIWTEGGEVTDLVPATNLPEKEQPDTKAVVSWLKGVETRAVSFLWDKIIPAGCVTLLAGQGGVAKSTFTLWLAGQLTRGTLPGIHHGKPQRVLMVSHEDSLAEVVKPRALANGVDTDLVGQLGIYSKEVGATLVPRLPQDIDALRDAIVSSGATVVIIDPVASTISGDTDKVVEVRAALDPLNALGHELGVSFIAVAHLRKGGGSGANLISGSHAYRDAARCSILFARDKDSNRTVFTVDKSNYGETGHSYDFEVVIVDQLVDDGATSRVGKIHNIQRSTLSAEDVINAANSVGEKRSSKKKLTATEVADYIHSLGATAVNARQVAQNFPDVEPGIVEWLMRDLVTKQILVQVGMNSYQASKYMPDQAPPVPLGYCRVCGQQEPCYRTHSAADLAAAEARPR